MIIDHSAPVENFGKCSTTSSSAKQYEKRRGAKPYCIHNHYVILMSHDDMIVNVLHHDSPDMLAYKFYGFTISMNFFLPFF
jgi:hypothetical protein